MQFPHDWPHWKIELDELTQQAPTGTIPSHWQGADIAVIRRDLNEVMLTRLNEALIREALFELLDWKSWTVDRLSQQAGDPRLVAANANSVEALQRVIGQLEAQAVNPRMSRRLRKLEVPDQVTVYNRGKNTKVNQSYQVETGNKYSIGLSDLKESVRFTVRGLDCDDAGEGNHAGAAAEAWPGC